MATCPVCGVKIDGDTVLFSHGPSGTRKRLYARVCQYNSDKRCINRGHGEGISPQDEYGGGEQGALFDVQKVANELWRERNP